LLVIAAVHLALVAVPQALGQETAPETSVTRCCALTKTRPTRS
jgi:hypothetical protein